MTKRGECELKMEGNEVTLRNEEKGGKKIRRKKGRKKNEKKERLLHRTTAPTLCLNAFWSRVQ